MFLLGSGWVLFGKREANSNNTSAESGSRPTKSETDKLDPRTVPRSGQIGDAVQLASAVGMAASPHGSVPLLATMAILASEAKQVAVSP